MRAVLPQTVVNALRLLPHLSATEERDLLSRVRDGDRRAGERLVLSQLRFVIRIARRYRRDGCALADLIQEGTVGLLEAIRRFNPDRGVRLSTFAMWWIRAAIQDYVVRSGSAVRVATTPRHRAMYFNSALSAEGGPSADTVCEIATRFGTTGDDVRSFADRLRRRPVSFDTVASDGRALTEILPDPGPDPEARLDTKRERIALVERLRAALPALTRRERDILRRRFLGEKRESLAKIARDLGLSKERVRQLEQRALLKMRSMAPLPRVG